MGTVLAFTMAVTALEDVLKVTFVIPRIAKRNVDALRLPAGWNLGFEPLRRDASLRYRSITLSESLREQHDIGYFSKILLVESNFFSEKIYGNQVR